MTKTLVIAEKPSVAQDIVRALTPVAGKFDKHEDHFENDRYVVTSAVGHLVEIQAPEQFDVKRGKWSFAHLPVIPPFFDLKPVDKTKSRLNAVVKQAKRKDVSELINACDAGREGELIFRLIEQYAGGAKSLDKPVQRLWLQSMTPQAIREGFEHLRSNHQMQGLADAARSFSRYSDTRLIIADTKLANEPVAGLFATSNPAALPAVLRPGDILLVEGSSRISTAIKYLTQSTWSHAALCIGDTLGPAADGEEPRIFVDVDVVEGVRTIPLSTFSGLHARICRPVGLSDEEIDNLIFMPGFSTASEISDMEKKALAAMSSRMTSSSLTGTTTPLG